MKIKNKYWDFIESTDYDGYHLSYPPVEAPKRLVEAAEFAEGIRYTPEARNRLRERLKRFHKQ